MKNKILLSLILVLSAITAFPQNVQNNYVMRIQENGILYFIKPLDVFSGAGNKAVPTDITYLTGDEAATVNFTYLASNTRQADSVMVFNDVSHYRAVAHKLFIEPAKKDKWKHRYSFEIPYTLFEREFISNERPLSLQVYTDGEPTEFKPRNWKKNGAVLRRIFQTISQNK